MDLDNVFVGAEVLTAKYACSCNSSSAETHLPACKLWDCWEFDHGWVVWDIEQKKLVDIMELDIDAKFGLPVKGGEAEGEDEIVLAQLANIGKDKGKQISTLFPTTNPSSTSTTTTYQKCRHYQQPVTMPDGTVIYASSSRSWAAESTTGPMFTPDLGIYLDGCWKPDTIAYHVGCPDYNIPLPSVTQVLWIAEEGLRLAREGQRVEVGCIGGHGRTGLMLAVMATLTQPDIEDAVTYVQTNYCSHAVESEVQEWYVEGIKCELAGEEWPKKPAYKSVSSSGWQDVKWKYASQSDIPDHFTKKEKTAAWSEHADDCSCSACKAKRHVPLCKVCNKELFSSAAIAEGQHTWDCQSKWDKETSTCPTCNKAKWEGYSAPLKAQCMDTFHCNSIRPDKCKCHRHHPASPAGCICERCT